MYDVCIKFMSRSAKKLIYGSFYTLIFALVLYALISPFFTKVESCFDGKKNQNETGIDCGGVCVSCEVKELSPLRSLDVKVFPLRSGQVVLLGTAVNPNELYDAEKFFYSFLVYDATNHLVETIEGDDSVSALEKRFIFTAGIKTKYQNVGRVVLETKDVLWKKSFGTLKPNISLLKAIETNMGEQNIKVRGVLKNESSVSASSIKVIGVLYDKYDIEIFASQSLISSLQAFEEKSFTITFPSDPNIIEHADMSKTKVFISTR